MGCLGDKFKCEASGIVSLLIFIDLILGGTEVRGADIAEYHLRDHPSLLPRLRITPFLGISVQETLLFLAHDFTALSLLYVHKFHVS